MIHLFCKAFLKLRDLIATLIAFLIRPILHDLIYKLNRLNQINLSTAALHQKTFLPFKGINKGKDVVIVACGPTLNEYVPIPNAVHIGVNRAYRQDKVNLDYLFAFDFTLVNKDATSRKEMCQYRQNECKKFFGFTNELSGGDWFATESLVNEANAFRFRADRIVWAGPCESGFYYDISTMPLADFGSIVFAAIQFALWTNPKRIFLVGCDCTAQGHFDDGSWITRLPTSLRSTYTRLKAFGQAYYPDTEIISVNPVGLKGLFRDWCQKEGPLTREQQIFSSQNSREREVFGFSLR